MKKVCPCLLLIVLTLGCAEGVSLGSLNYGSGLITGTLFGSATGLEHEGILYSLNERGKWRRARVAQESDFGWQWGYMGAEIAPDGTTYFIAYTDVDDRWVGLMRFDGAGEVEPVVPFELGSHAVLFISWAEDGAGMVILEERMGESPSRQKWYLFDGVDLISGPHTLERPLVTTWFDGGDGWMIQTESTGDWSPFGTSVHRFDGAGWQEQELPVALANDTVAASCGSAGGNLWIDTGESFWSLDGETWVESESRVPVETYMRNVTCLSDGTAYANDTVAHPPDFYGYDGVSWTLLSELADTSGSILDYTVTDDGRLWLLSNGFLEEGPIYEYADGDLIEHAPDRPLDGSDPERVDHLTIVVR